VHPISTITNVNAPEVPALVHPNSLSIGSRKTPKVLLAPQTIAIMKKHEVTIT
jgi:hypothetical protein